MKTSATATLPEERGGAGGGKGQPINAALATAQLASCLAMISISPTCRLQAAADPPPAAAKLDKDSSLDDHSAPPAEGQGKAVKGRERQQKVARK